GSRLRHPADHYHRGAVLGAARDPRPPELRGAHRKRRQPDADAAWYVALAEAAFSKAWGLGFSLDNFTLENFRHLLAEEGARRTIVHSFTYSAAAACVAVVLALLVAYVVNRNLMRGGSF